MLIFQVVDPRHSFEKTLVEFVALFRRPACQSLPLLKKTKPRHWGPLFVLQVKHKMHQDSQKSFLTFFFKHDPSWDCNMSFAPCQMGLGVVCFLFLGQHTHTEARCRSPADEEELLEGLSLHGFRGFWCKPLRLPSGDFRVGSRREILLVSYGG